jgi:O-antigen ligase
LLIAASPLSKPGTNIALGLCAVLFVRDWLAGRRRPQSTPLDGAILAWVAANLLSALTSIDPLRSFRDLRSIGHWGAYYFVAWAVASGTSLRLLQNVWLAAGGLTAFAAFVQGVVHVDPLGRARDVPTGFFGGHLELGHYMVVLFGLAMARWNDAGDRHERRLMLLGMVAFAAALVISQGRGPWLAFLAVVACGGAVVKRGRVVAVLGLVVAIQFAFLMRQELGPTAFYRSYLTIEKEEESPVAGPQIASNAWRVAMWRDGLRFFALRPVTGTGVETTRSLSHDFRTPFPDLAVAHLHSNYFEILMTRGFVGLTSFFLLLIVASRRIAEGLGRVEPGESRAALFVALAAVVAHLVHGLTHFTVGSSWIQLGFYVGLGLGVGELLRREKGVRQPLCEAPAEQKLSDPFFPIFPAWTITIIALTIVAAPWLASRPVLATVLGLAAMIDCGARWAAGRRNAVDLALVAALGFIVFSSFVLLIWAPETRPLGVRVLVAAGAPFAIIQAGRRIGEAAIGRQTEKG